MTKADIVARSSELGRQLEIRKSRDRIARGVFANVVFLAVAGLFAGSKLPTTALVWCAGSAAAMYVTYKIWRRMEGLSHRYRVLASDALTKISSTQVPSAGVHNSLLLASAGRLPIVADPQEQVLSPPQSTNQDRSQSASGSSTP